MIEKPLNPSYKLRANIRPVRIVYFIPWGDTQAFERLIRLVCTQWGGKNHLIIPINPDTPADDFYTHLLRLFDPDLFVCYFGYEKQCEEIKEFIEKYVREIFQRQINLQMAPLFEEHDHTTHALHAIPQSILQIPQVMNRKYVKDAENQLLSLALFGDIYPGQQDYYRAAAYVSDTEIDSRSKEYWSNQLETHLLSSILNLTSYGSYAYRVAGPVNNFDFFIIMVVDNVDDFCLYWNLRAMREAAYFRREHDTGYGRRVLCLPSSHLDNQSSINSLLDVAREKLFTPGRTANLDLIFRASTQVLRDKVKNILEASPKVKLFSEDKVKGNSEFWGRSKNTNEEVISERPLSYLINYSILPPDSFFEGIEGTYHAPYILRFGQNEIQINLPASYHNSGSGAVAVDFDSDVWDRYPRSGGVARLIEGNSWFSKYGLTAVRSSITSHPFFVPFSLPGERESLKTYFAEKGYTIEYSKEEQYSDAFIKTIGGIEKIDILMSKTALKLIDILTFKSSKKVAQHLAKQLQLTDRVEEIAAGIPLIELPDEEKSVNKTFEELKSEINEAGLPTTGLLDLIEKLCNAQVLKRGYYIECPNCGTLDWYPLREINESLTCSGCSHTFLLPVKESPGSTVPIQLRYRLNTLTNRVSNLDIFAAMIGLRHLTREKETYCNTCGLQLYKDGKQITDFDFIYLLNRELHCGECKTGTSLGEKDFSVARLAASLGITKFYFCTLKEFDKETLSKIEALKTEFQKGGLSAEIDILSGNELLGKSLQI
jgi:hypothetical protein